MSETQEQEALIQRAQLHPITRDLLYAIPNDGIRTPAQGAMFKRRGLRPGMPDICLPYPSNGFHALYIELKRADKKNKTTATQDICIANLRKAGNAAYVAYGWVEAWGIINDYLRDSMKIKTKVDSSLQITEASYSEKGSTWNITMTGSSWPWMMKLPKVKCKECGTSHLQKNGWNDKHKQKYKCMNKACPVHSFVI
jgi:hypothetical protein